MVKLTFLLVVFSMITVNITTLKILKKNDLQNSSNADQKVIKILKRCFQNTFKTIIASFKSNEYVMNFLEELPDTPIILVNNDERVYYQKWLFSGVIIYVLEINSSEDLETTLTTLHRLPRWDHRSRFFLIGSSNNSCIDAKKILNTMWAEKILSTVYVCHDHKENVHKIFTFNPFTNKAPKSWKLSEHNSNGRWTLYEQLFQENEKICLNLMFDKTKYLDGYEMKACYRNHRYKEIKNSSLVVWLPIMDVPLNFLISDMSKQLNVSITVESLNKTTLINDYFGGPFLESESNKYDIFLNGHPIFYMYPHKTSPIFRLSLTIYTERRPLLRPEEKISMYYFQNFTYFSVFIFIIFASAKVLQKSRYQKFSVALIKIWESVFRQSIRDDVEKFGVRFFFCGVFIYFAITTESFKGNLTAFLTKPERLHVDTIQDLLDLGYRVFIHEFWKYYPLNKFENIPKKKLFYFSVNHCELYIDNNTACICPKTHFNFLNLPKNKKVHISKNIISEYISWMISPQFPLKERFDTNILRYIQTGITYNWYERDWERKIRKMRVTNADEAKAQFRPIEFEDLVFAFKFLIIGLSCSFVVFIMEISRR